VPWCLGGELLEVPLLDKPQFIDLFHGLLGPTDEFPGVIGGQGWSHADALLVLGAVAIRVSLQVDPQAPGGLAVT